MTQSPDRSQRVYRVGRFAVPAAAREEFHDFVQNTHALLREQPSFVQEVVLEQPLDGGGTGVVTIVEGKGAGFFDEARAALHSARGVSPLEMMARLGIQVELGVYTPIGR